MTDFDTPPPLSIHRTLSKFIVIIPITIILIATIVFILLQQFVAAPAPTHFILTSSAQDVTNSISYQTIKHIIPRATSTINYPLVDQPEIDQTIASAVEQIYTSFVNFIPAEHSTQDYQQIVSYTYLPVQEQYLSIALNEEITASDQTVAKSYLWTFDRSSGDTVKLAQILKNDSILKIYNIDNLLQSSFVIDAPNRQLLIAPNNQLRPIDFSILKDHVVPSIARAFFGFELLIAQTPNNTDCSTAKCLALTFDDGPGMHTDHLLDILKQSAAKATFFVLGSRASAFSTQIARAVDEGHNVGSHSWNHKNLPIFSYGQISQDLSSTTNAIQQLSNQPVKYFRPPYGNINNSVRQVTQNLGQQTILWSIDPLDWQDKDPSRICEHIVTHAHPGAIILLHDIHITSVDAAKCVIDRLSYEYTFVNLDTLYK